LGLAVLFSFRIAIASFVPLQLSLVKIMPGYKVLLVGGKGGYINSIVAQIVGINGEVVTMSSSQHILETCRHRVRMSPLRKMMEWVQVSDCSKASSILQVINPNRKFNAIIFCGCVDTLPELDSIIEDGGCLIAPVRIKTSSQQLQMLTIESKTAKEFRKISEFGVSFETPK